MQARPDVSTQRRPVRQQPERDRWLNGHVDFVNNPCKDADETDDERGEDLCGVPRELDAAPRQTEQGGGRTTDNEDVSAENKKSERRARNEIVDGLHPVYPRETLRKWRMGCFQVEEE